jgi:hypothetical protein
MSMAGGMRASAAILSALLALGLPVASARASTVSQSFTTAGEHPFVVPPSVTSVQATLVGGSGGPGNGETPGGSGATVTATLALAAGETLYTEVAGNGQGTKPGEEALGGYGGSGDGGIRIVLFASAPGGGGGGGASDVRTCAASATPSECSGHSSLQSRLLVAAGGGGGGGIGLPFSEAGDGGPADLPGYPGFADSHGDAGGSGGTRGTLSAGGSGGSPSLGCEPKSGEGCAADGLLGLGGGGGDAQGGGGGGGGGGIFGGGGGGGGQGGYEGSGANITLYNAGGGGGGGGSSGVPAGTTGVSGYSLVPTAEGAQPSVTFSWTAPAPTVVTDAASAVSATTATLNGTVDPNLWQLMSCGFDISPAPAGVATFPCAQQLAAGGTPAAVSATAAGLAPATTYTVTLGAASTQGTSNGGAVTFTTAAASPSGSKGPGSGTSGSGPTVSALKLSPTRFRRGTHIATLASGGHRGKRGIPIGTTISFTLSEAAMVKLGFQRAEAGWMLGHRCVSPASHGRRGHRCTRYAAVHGSVSIAAPAGVDRIGFDGVLDGGARLAPGGYRLVVSATAGSSASSPPQHPSFTLLA